MVLLLGAVHLTQLLVGLLVYCNDTGTGTSHIMDRGATQGDGELCLLDCGLGFVMSLRV
jgi:hypothetical protein